MAEANRAFRALSLSNPKKRQVGADTRAVGKGKARGGRSNPAPVVFVHYLDGTRKHEKMSGQPLQL
jgi:hypothetical protein